MTPTPVVAHEDGPASRRVQQKKLLPSRGGDKLSSVNGSVMVRLPEQSQRNKRDPMTKLSRRSLLGGLAAGGVALLVPGGTRSAQAAAAR